MTNEEWREINEFPNCYISNLGNVKSFDARVGRIIHRKLQKTNCGYLRVALIRNHKQHLFLVHRLVAAAFIPNPNAFPYINHKNEDKTDNRVENLEWCDHSYNMKYGSRTEKALLTKKLRGRQKAEIPVEQWSKDGNLVASYKSIHEAERQTGIAESSIRQYLHNKRKIAGGYLWKIQK